MIKQFLKIKPHLFFWIFFYIFLFVLVLNNSYSYLDPDLGWHLRVGEEISLSGQVPSDNLYNYTYTGSWVDHEWLANLWLYRAYSAWGYQVVSAFFALLVIAILVLLNIRTQRRWQLVPPSLIVALQTLGVMAALPSLGVRLQEFGLVFLFIILLIMEAYERRRDWRLPALLPVVFYFWASLHASFLLGLFLLVAWLMVKATGGWLRRTRFRAWLSDDEISSRDLAIFSIGAAAALIATLLTPYRLELYAFLGGYSDNFYQMHIREWLSQHIFPLQYWQLFYMAIAASLAGLYLYQVRLRRAKISLWDFFLLLLFLFLAWRSRRHFPLFLIATFPFLISAGNVLFLETTNCPVRSWPRWLKAYILVALILISSSLLLQSRLTADPFRSHCQSYPCGAADFLESKPEYAKKRLFNDYGWGGYLIWRLPDRQLFIDGRLPQAEFGGHTFLEEYYEFYKEGADIAAKLDEHDIGLVLITAQDRPVSLRAWEKFFFQISEEELVPQNYLRDYLESADWTVVYADETAKIYARSK